MKYSICILLSFLFSLVAAGQDKKQLKEEIDKIIHFDTDISHDKIPGYVIGIIVADSVFTYGYGQKSKEELVAPDANTLFEIGSVTKLFTASLAGLLADEGLMSHDAPLNTYLPEAFQNPKLEHITIGSLLTHTSGLPKMPTMFGIHEAETDNPYAHYSKDLLLEFYSKYEPESDEKPSDVKQKKQKESQEKNVTYNYSHLNYALLEVAIEAVSGQSFATLLEQRILNKIGMNNSFMEVPKETEEEALTVGYSRSGLEATPWEFASFAASQGMKSTTNDLIKFLQVHLENPSDTLSLSFYNNTLPAIQTGLTEDGAMGYGWHILHQKKYYDIILHAGSTGGHRAFVGFIRETKTGVVILSNSENSMGGLGYLLLRLINFNWKKGG
jgi:CubicO group peptidase (beta-lactamase class C family)